MRAEHIPERRRRVTLVVVRFSELQLESELDRARSADLVERVEAAICATGSQAACQRCRRLTEMRVG